QFSSGSVDHFRSATTTYINRRGVTYGDPWMHWALGQMNDGNTVFENITHLVGDNSTGHAKAVPVGRREEIQNFTTKSVNVGRETDAQILQHGVNIDSATTIFNAIGKIEH